MDNIAFDYGTNKSIVYYAIKWTEKTLIKNKTFHLPSRKKLLEDTSIEIIVIDTTEVEIERPQKTEKVLFRKEKKTYNKNSDYCG